MPASNKPTEEPLPDGGGEESRNLAYTDELPAELVRQDFVSRDRPNGRRAFLLEFSKEVNERDFTTQRALDQGQYLSDDKLIALKAKIKAPNLATTLQLLHMNSSAGGALQDQSSNSSAEDIFPPTTSAYQKE